MMTIYMVAEEKIVTEVGEEVVEHRVCHNLDGYYLERDAQRKCDDFNRQAVREDPNMQEGPYFVKPVVVR